MCSTFAEHHPSLVPNFINCTSRCTAAETLCVCFWVCDVWPALTLCLDPSQLPAAKWPPWTVETLKSEFGSGGSVPAVQPHPSSLQMLFLPHVCLWMTNRFYLPVRTSMKDASRGRWWAAEISPSLVYVGVWVWSDGGCPVSFCVSSLVTVTVCVQLLALYCML